ncbi:DUF6457 domain-containing protein [Streptomyces sp. WMMC500]|uniref:DUF6457 domain-containing protein n=1 Tax=Streptomyces sp. WMMC500 TaxID=3015154 RepID=UPI00248BD9EB|nr:DUF6457 domain-containing protein [Streptomyces sp. WMMC500]WBB57857.1 DUF6457 domain-containing protein [Streptomyces sp. WMMC500]
MEESGGTGPGRTVPGARSGAAGTYAAVVLAGGAARRLGGVDKMALTVGGRTLLDRVLRACRGAGQTVVVGPRRPTVRPVTWTREAPPGGGPVAALAAALPLTSADTVVLLSADLPFLDDGTVRTLRDALAAAGDGVDGAMLVDGTGRDQPLVAAYRGESLRRGVALLAAEHGGLAGLPLRLLTGELRLVRSASGATFDCDTWEDLATARDRIREHGHVLDEWLAAVKEELGLDTEVDTRLLLDLARDAAHGVARPAAPLTTFLVGYAAGRAGGGPEAVAEATRKVTALTERWAEEAAAEGRADT